MCGGGRQGGRTAAGRCPAEMELCSPPQGLRTLAEEAQLPSAALALKRERRHLWTYTGTCTVLSVLYSRV